MANGLPGKPKGFGGLVGVAELIHEVVIGHERRLSACTDDMSIATDAKTRRKGRVSISTDMRPFRDRLREAAKHFGVEYGQTAIARALSVPKQTVDQWMGNSAPSAQMVFHIADKWAGLSPRWLALEEGPMILGQSRAAIGAPLVEPDEVQLIMRYRAADARWKLALKLLAGLADEDQVQAATDINVIIARILGVKAKDLKYPTDKEVEAKLGLPPTAKKLKQTK